MRRFSTSASSHRIRKRRSRFRQRRPSQTAVRIRCQRIEPLEARDLLAADLVFQMPTTGFYDLSVESSELVIRDLDGVSLLEHAADDVATLTIAGTSGNDTLRIRETADGLPHFSGDTGFQLSSFVASGLTNANGNQNIGLRFEAGPGDDALELVTTDQQVAYFSGQADPTDPTQKRGNLSVAGQFNLSFDGLTPQVIPSTGGTLLVDASADPEATILTLRDDETDLAGTGGMMVTGDGGFETVFFNGFTEIVVVGGEGSETLVLESFDAATSLTSLTLNGDNSTNTDASPDEIVVLALPTGITANLLGGGGDDVFTLDQFEGAVELGNIIIDGGTQEFGDSFQYSGDDVLEVVIAPDSVADVTQFDYGTNSLTYRDIEVPLIGAVRSATFVTPNQEDVFDLFEISAGGPPVLTFSGTSDGVAIDGPIFANVPSITLDTATNDGIAAVDTLVFEVIDLPQGVSEVNLITGSSDDSIAIRAVAEGLTTNVRAGSGNDLIEIGTIDFGVNNIAGVVTTSGGENEASPTWEDTVTAAGNTLSVANPSGDTLRVIDFITSFDSAFNISANAFEAVGLSPFTYEQIETLELVTGQAVNQINILGTPDNSTLRIQAADSVDLVTIENSGTGSLIDISTFAGNDEIFVNDTGSDSFVRLDTNAGSDLFSVIGTGTGSGFGVSLGDAFDTTVIETLGIGSTASILGDEGEDLLNFSGTDGDANVEFVGGAGNDQFNVAPGAFAANLLLSGGPDSDDLTVGVPATDATDDLFVLVQNRIGQVIEGSEFSVAYDSLESVGLFTGGGNDVIDVTLDPNLVFTIDGGAPSSEVTGDELKISDSGLTNVIITPEQGESPGTVTADGFGNLLQFSDIEILPTDPIEPPLGDRFEENETIATATPLGPEPIQSIGEVDLHVAGDVDVYEFTAADTGKLMVSVLFNHEQGDLDLRVIDAGGQVLGASSSPTDNETIVLPVVAQEDYYIEVSSSVNAIADYTLEVENTVAPTATSVSLDAASDTGRSNADGITADFTPRFLIQADLSEFAAMGIPILDGASALAGDAGAAVVIRFTDRPSGETVSDFASPVDASSALWDYEIATGLVDGEYLVGASVVIIDGQRPAPAVGETEISPLAEIVIDSASPSISIPELIPGFDTGMVDSDQVTNRNQIVLTGFATPSSTVVVTASNPGGTEFTEVGNATADADEVGQWSLTTDMLPDGSYEFFASAESPSGVVAVSDPTSVYVIDTVAPEIARISLISSSVVSSGDLLTNVNRPQISLLVDDVDGPLFPHDVKYRLYLFPDQSHSEIVLEDSFEAMGDFIDGGQYSYEVSLPSGADLPDGTHGLRVEVEDRAGNTFSSSELTFTVDTTPPQISFGLPEVESDGLAAVSDTGVVGDRVTSDTTPTLFGFAEPGTALEFFVRDAEGTLVPIGQTRALESGWETTPFVDLGDAGLNFESSVRELVVRGTDAVGNSSEDELSIILEATTPTPSNNAAKIGIWAGGTVLVDANGNRQADPTGEDGEMTDLVYRIGFVSDDVFAGNFVADANARADGFDKVAAYGDIGISYHIRQFRFLIDANNDGIVNADDGDIVVHTDRDINGLPIAGRFDANDSNGDEVGVFDGRAWWLDRNHDFQPNFRLLSELRGYPIVGDFDADGFDDLATYNEDQNRFEFDLTNGERRGWDGQMDTFFTFEYTGKRDRPIAADFDADGIDDIGLWAPDVNSTSPNTTGEWFILVSGGDSVLNRIEHVPAGEPGVQTINFTGSNEGDIYAQFGDDYALPIAGNFGAPAEFVAPLSVDPVTPLHNVSMPNDVNNDGRVSPLDALIVINLLNEPSLPSLFADTDGDGAVSPLDAIRIVNELDLAKAVARQSSVVVALPIHSVSDAATLRDAPAVHESPAIPVADEGTPLTARERILRTWQQTEPWYSLGSRGGAQEIASDEDWLQVLAEGLLNADHI